VIIESIVAEDQIVAEISRVQRALHAAAEQPRATVEAS